MSCIQYEPTHAVDRLILHLFLALYILMIVIIARTYVVLYCHCLYMCCVVQSLQVLTVRIYILIAVCMYVRMYLCTHAFIFCISKYYHASMYILHVLEQYRLVFIVIYAAVLGVHACTCKCNHMLMYIYWYMHTCMYTHILQQMLLLCHQEKMLKQYAPSTILVLMVMVVLSVAGWRVVCLVFRKLSHLRIFHCTACITYKSQSFFVCEIDIFSVFQLYLSASALSTEWIVHMQNSHNNYCLLIGTVVNILSV